MPAFASVESVDCNFSAGIPSDFTLTDADGNTLAPGLSKFGFVQGDSWIAFRQDDGNTVACSTSWYKPAGTSSDWMTLPQLKVLPGSVLTWRAVASDSRYRDGYSVYIGEKGALPADFEGVEPALKVEAENAEWTSHTIDLAPWEGKEVWIAFVNDSKNKSRLFIDDILAGKATDIRLELSMNPFVVIGKKLEVSGYITNTGSETFSNPELTVNIDGTDYTARLKDVSVASGERVPFTQTLRYTPWETGLSNYTLTLESGDLEASASGSFRRVNHKIVVEEGTGVWCGYCVRGIASFEHCEQLFPDNFIPIAIHGGNDPMGLDDYSFETICTCPGYPAATVNRSGFFDIAPTRLASEITSRLQTPPAAALDLEMTVTGSSASVDAEIFFPSFYSNADYRMAAFLKEDGICHPDDFSYNQSNGYAGGADGSMGGFENLPNPILCKDITYLLVELN